ncbi:mycothiol system anti-sigma-R factor [Streptomyces chattanoogensis]|uniref:Anti-sigma factor n=1 Tax=Streptomyces chattanoogensis TaxID=66876 RepID=A0A0N0H474_9ACTN|nr:mycothiol system anti-sigma-R factor [Streptomyces chattanoogensis]AJT64500.1 Anti-sigma factor RsrA [Streptomyces lydicus]KPC66879.1 anti-sigma factor [Streptomyces chattanoogensis]
MSCGEPHEKDCSEVLDHLYEYLDREMPAGECAEFQVHLDECSPCLEKYGLEQAVKKLVKRCCGHDDVPTDLRSKVMGRIDLIRAGETVPEVSVLEQAKNEQAEREQAQARKEQAQREPSSGTADAADAHAEAARGE